MVYRVEFERRAAKELAALPAPARERILKALDRLADDPRASGNIKALHGGGYRLRVGDYRVLYVVKDDLLLVLVVKVGHRKDVYRGR
ncbi:MAG: type II toxin-antitoxin system RelE/ParE family toxin [Rhodospirillaceae bacterium]|nr:type II toxin-antitoxin system RelE/ParE family toxin [Rhodospirillaceae bacterium]